MDCQTSIINCCQDDHSYDWEVVEARIRFFYNVVAEETCVRRIDYILRGLFIQPENERSTSRWASESPLGRLLTALSACSPQLYKLLSPQIDGNWSGWLRLASEYTLGTPGAGLGRNSVESDRHSVAREYLSEFGCLTEYIAVQMYAMTICIINCY